MSYSVWPHRQQPTRLLCPWDSPGKNTGVGCHFLLQCIKVKSESEVAQLCLTLSDPMDCSLPGSSIHGIFQARGLEWGATLSLCNFKGEFSQTLMINISRAIWILTRHRKLFYEVNILIERIKNQTANILFHDYQKIDYKVYLERQRPRIASTILKNKVGVLT